MVEDTGAGVRVVVAGTVDVEGAAVPPPLEQPARARPTTRRAALRWRCREVVMGSLVTNL